jgi:glutamate synthase domain-containing protein 1
MCGIVGVFLKNPGSQPQLGGLLAGMLAQMTERGPDSAGFAVYGDAAPKGAYKATLFHPDAKFDWAALGTRLDQEFGLAAPPARRGSHCIVTVRAEAETLRDWLARNCPEIRPMGFGERIEIFKERGRPDEVIASFGLASMSGSHALGHTRMATESAVTTEHSHPFSTGVDLCLVHNGSLSNHNRLRRALQREGVRFQTDNDSEVAAGYLTWRMREGATLEQALDGCLEDLDGFYTFAVGTADGFAVLRDPIACKPAVMAETDEWVAMASEYRALAMLPGAADARVWEPEPAVVYAWEKAAV